MTKVFISYSREDWDAVSILATVLRENGLEVWVDRAELQPGQRWENAIKQAIQGGTFFLCVYSRAREKRGYGYANEELVLAIDEIRKRPSHKTWFIPVKIDNCNIDDRPIGGGESISNFQICDLTQGKDEFRKLLKSLGIQQPTLDFGIPLGNNLPSFINIIGGYISYNNIPQFEDTMGKVSFPITGGWVTRNENDLIVAYIQTQAPFGRWQEFNESLELSAFYAVSNNKAISSNMNNPSIFQFERTFTLKKGLKIPNINTGDVIQLPFDLDITSSFQAKGIVSNSAFEGLFEAVMSANPLLGGPISIPMNGEFRILFSS